MAKEGYKDMQLKLKEKFPNFFQHQSQTIPQEKLNTGLFDIDYFLEEGLSFGQLTEWGIPWGSGGRSLIVHFLAEASRRKQYGLWVHDQEGLELYPPAWQHLGVDLKYFRSSVTSQEKRQKSAFGFTRKKTVYARAIDDLKPAFMSPFFKVIIIDCHISPQDYAFLSQRARCQKQLIFVLRKHHLSSRMGNVWAKSRLNVWRDPLSKRFYLQSVKGFSPRQICFRLEGGVL